MASLENLDRINIKKLRVFAHHGVFVEENIKGQNFYISCVIYLDAAASFAEDDLQNTVNYADVCKFICDYTKNSTFNLIETLACGLAYGILQEYKKVVQVTVEVSKPEAPVGCEFEDISVIVTRMRHTAYIALGSNIGDKNAYLNDAVEALNNNEYCEVKKTSSFIKTEPYGVLDQPEFLNGALELETLLDPFELLNLLSDIEVEAGRERTVRWGPRTLDLDILLYDNEIIDTERLIVPHKEMHLRSFVLEPMSEIAPYVRHPLNGKTVLEMLNELEEQK